MVGVRASVDWEAPAELVGLSPQTGDLLWRFGPADAQPIGCADQLLDGDLACLVEGESGDTAVVLLDTATGEELGRFALPARSPALAVDGSQVIAVLFPQWPAAFDEVEVARYTRSGTPVWSTTFSRGDDILGTDSFRQRIAVTDGLVLLNLTGTLRVLDGETGALVVDSGLGGYLVTNDGRVVLGLRDPMTFDPSVAVLQSDGTVDHTLPGMRLLAPRVLGGESPVLLGDAEGQIYVLDVISGAPAALGANPEVGLGQARASLVGDILIVSDGYVLYGYDVADPGAAWYSAWDYRDGFTDGERVYGVARHGTGEEGLVTAIDAVDGEVAWQLERAAEVLTVAGGRLFAVEGDAITLFGP